MRLAAGLVGLTLLMLLGAGSGCQTRHPSAYPSMKTNNPIGRERQVTRARRGHILTNIGAWSPDGQWLVYDTRSDKAGDLFDGSTIERVHVETGEAQILYRSQNGAHCGVATYHPQSDRVVFILGPENPSADWQYCPFHRRGVFVDAAAPLVARNLDARDLTPPFTPGALRGGSHVHVFSPDGQWVSFTYEDHVLSRFAEPGPGHDLNQRNIGVSVPAGSVRVSKVHPRNHDGECFTVLVTRTVAEPRRGSDEIKRAFEEGWIGCDGYRRADGSWQRRALAFQGQVVTEKGDTISEVFVVDLPDDLTRPGNGPLAGTESRAPSPPAGVVQRRLTFTAHRKHPGLQGPRHWLRSSPDGSRIAFLMKDDAGIVQLWTISPNGGEPRQITRNPWSIASAFSWSPDGNRIGFVMDNSVWTADAATGQCTRLTARTPDASAPRPEACIFSPDGRMVAFVRHLADSGQSFNQIFVVALD